MANSTPVFVAYEAGDELCFELLVPGRTSKDITIEVGDDEKIQVTVAARQRQDVGLLAGGGTVTIPQLHSAWTHEGMRAQCENGLLLLRFARSGQALPLDRWRELIARQQWRWN